MGFSGQDYGYLSLDQVKQAVVVDRMKKLENNQTHAAASLGITRNTLVKLLAQFEKNDKVTQARIEANIALLSKMQNPNVDPFEFDVNTGMSTPKKPEPLKVPVLLTARQEEPTALNEAVGAMETKAREGMVYLGNATPSPIVPVPNEMKSEIETERKHFSSLDKKLYSENHPIGEKAKAEIKTTKPAKKAKGKKKKAKAGVK